MVLLLVPASEAGFGCRSDRLGKDMDLTVPCDNPGSLQMIYAKCEDADPAPRRPLVAAVTTSGGGVDDMPVSSG
jgi:hypothetical protein